MHDKKSFLAYLIPFIVYVFIAFVLSLFIKDINLVLVLRVVLMVGLLSYYAKYYTFRFAFSWFTLVAGVAIFLLWVGLDGLYPNIGEIHYVPPNLFYFVIRIIAAVIVAPIIEEYFVRFFLNRVIVSKHIDDWSKLPVYRFTVSSFLITVLFFGFSHNRWIAGLITGFILNLVLIKERKIDYCIMAHMLANILLVVYILVTGNYGFW
jgi:uncharacterized protein